MRSSAVLIVSALVARAAASYNYTFPAGFNLGEVTDAQKRSWCLAETNACPQICGGAASPNNCDPSTLSFECTCVNGTVPDVEPYINTIPFFVCQANFDQCIQNNPNDLDGQKACKENAKCGTLKPTSGQASTTSSASSSSSTLSSAQDKAATTSATATSSASATAATGTSSPTTGAAVAVQPVQAQSAGVLAAAVMAVLGLMM
ncbi:hypothetical protein PISL3812_06876 [Talaromyces islandicus]|uniref:DUF7707 domain-containing protein n=1 Tax=Talaromyces islandicus TaxID=28573 RepID=A0A0U1M2P8_TALIS|nr:hypothetical protein PISL3812_06876 [Talaromyces islandicus]